MDGYDSVFVPNTFPEGAETFLMRTWQCGLRQELGGGAHLGKGFYHVRSRMVGDEYVIKDPSCVQYLEGTLLPLMPSAEFWGADPLRAGPPGRDFHL